MAEADFSYCYLGCGGAFGTIFSGICYLIWGVGTSRFQQLNKIDAARTTRRSNERPISFRKGESL